MNTDQQNPADHQNEPSASADDQPAVPSQRRPFGFWLKVVDRRLSEEMATLFADEGLSRRDWRALNLLAGSAEDERLAERLHSRPHLLHRIAEHGWVGRDGELNDAGREARDRLQTRVDGLRARVAGSVSDEDFATTMRTLETIARELGWDESQPMPRGRRGGRRFGERGNEHRHGHGHGHRHGHGHGRDRHEEEHGRGFAQGWPGEPKREHGRRHEECGEHGHDRRRDWHGDRRRQHGPAGFEPRGERFGARGEHGGRPGRGDVQLHIHVHG